MADSYPPFTTMPFTRANNIYRNNKSNNYLRFLGKLLFLTFFLIAIPLFPSQAPDFINQTVLSKFWELLHLLFIGIAVSYGLFCRRNVDNGNLDDSHPSYVSGMFHVSSIFGEGFDHSMYYSGQGKAGFFNVKNDSFDNLDEENVVQAWSSKYVQEEPMVVLAQPHCGLQNYGELGSFIDHQPLGLPVRSLKSRVGSPVGSEFGNGSSGSSCTSVMDLSDSSDKSRGGRFVDLGTEKLEGKFNNESDVLGSPIPWRPSRSGRMRQRVRGGATRPSHFRPLSVDETRFESLKSRSLQSTVSFSSHLSSQSSHSHSSLSTSHSNSSESPKSKMSESSKERSPRQSFPPTSPSIPRLVSSKASVNASHSRQYSDGSLLGTHARKCFEDELKEFCDSKKDDSSSSKEWISGSFKFDATSPSIPKPASSKASVDGSHSRQYSDGSLLGTHERKCFEDELKEFCDSKKDDLSSNKEWISGSFKFDATSPSIPKSVSSKASVNGSHSRQYSDGSLLGTHERKCFEDELKEFCDSKKDDSSSSKEWILGSSKFDATSPSIPKSVSSKASVNGSRSRQSSDGSLLGTRERKCFDYELKEFCDRKKDDSSSSKERISCSFKFDATSPSIPKSVISKASVNGSHSRQYSDGSLLGTHARKCFEDELKEFYDSKKDDSSSSKEWILGSFKFDVKPVAPSKASLRGKSVRTFRTIRGSSNNIGSRDAGEKQENHEKEKLTMGSDEIEEAYTGETEAKIGHNNLSVGFNRQNHGIDSDIPKPTSSRNQNREKQECSENSDLESENEDFQVSSDEETMSETFSVDRKAGEFIAKFREQIRLQRTTSIDTPRGLDITGNFFR